MNQQEKQNIEEDLQKAKLEMNYNNKEREKKSIWKTILTLAIIIAIISGAIYGFSLIGKAKLQYTSIKYQLNKTYIYFSVENASMKTINIEDFSIMVDGTPRKAESFEDNKKTFEIDKTEQHFCVIFKFYEGQLDKPIKVFYKGNEIKFNKGTRIEL